MSIVLQCRNGCPIPNVQDEEFNLQQLNFARLARKRYVTGTVRFINGASGFYNCAGLVFASRRTQIIELSQVNTILKEDGYYEVPEDEAQVGDVATFEYNGSIEHVAIVLSSINKDLPAPRVLSKWGGSIEAEHYPYEGPYAQHQVRYFRMRTYDIPE